MQIIMQQKFYYVTLATSWFSALEEQSSAVSRRNLALALCLVLSAQWLLGPLCSSRQWPVSRLAICREAISGGLPQLPSCAYPQTSLFLVIPVLPSSCTWNSACIPPLPFWLLEDPVTSRHQLWILYCIFNPATPRSFPEAQKHVQLIPIQHKITPRPNEPTLPLIQYPSRP